MRSFSDLFWRLDQTTKNTLRVAALVDYFKNSSSEDASWALFFLSGRTLPRGANSRQLREWIGEETGLPLWLIEESYDSVGDLAETLALLLPDKKAIENTPSLESLVREILVPLRKLEEEQKKQVVREIWRKLPRRECFVFNKLLTGGFRVGVSEGLIIQALSQLSGVPEEILSHRLMGEWSPSRAFWLNLISTSIDTAESTSRPYPFYLASPVEGVELGDVNDYQVEWKWDGIRGQLVARESGVFLWSRGGENLTERFPEVVELGKQLPQGTVLDGEILAWREEVVLSFSLLQTRITRKKITKSLLHDVPVTFLAYDLLEENGTDIRALPLRERRKRLESIQHEVSGLRLSPKVTATSWEELRSLRQTSREKKVEGFMLKHSDSRYGVGRERGAWWKWKVEPLTLDAVLVYAQKGHGRRANLFTDYTFAVWKSEELVPIAKAYSGLTDKEITEVDEFIRKNTIERFGPVRTVKPVQVFEIAFEGIQESTRHKSGIAVRFPRILRWRKDKRPEDADTLESLKVLGGIR